MKITMENYTDYENYKSLGANKQIQKVKGTSRGRKKKTILRGCAVINAQEGEHERRRQFLKNDCDFYKALNENDCKHYLEGNGFLGRDMVV
eukprot:Awhi_evm1s1720